MVGKYLKEFYTYSDLRPNYEKCEIAGIGTKKGALGALCGMATVDLTLHCVKILGIHFSYNKDLTLGYLWGGWLPPQTAEYSLPFFFRKLILSLLFEV